MPFSPDIFNDFQLLENPSEGRFLDVSGIMLDRHLRMVNPQSDTEFNDIQKYSPEVEELDIQADKIIRIYPLRPGHSGDIYLPEQDGFPLFNPLRKYRNFKSRTVSVIEPLGKLGADALDIRTMEYIPREKRSDIYLGNLPVYKSLYRYSRKHKKVLFHVGKKTAKFGIIFGITLVSLIVFAVGLKNYIQSETTAQYSRLYNLKTLRDPTLIKEESAKIRAQFAHLGLLFAPIDLAFNNSFYTNDSVKLAHDIIYGGREVADMATLLGEILESGKEFAAKNPSTGTGGTDVIGMLSNLKTTDFLRDNEETLFTMQEHLHNAVHYYGEIKTLGDATLDAKFNKAFETLYETQKQVDFVLTNFESILYALGDSKPQRYVFLNQNRDEIRASGGFPGSVITLELYKGAIQKYDKKDVYYYDWHLYPYKEVPPEGLNKISDNYGLRDANYYPEFSKSLDKINFFYEKAGGGSIDTLIAINQGVVIDFLEKYGSINLKEVKTEVTADNFSTLMSILVENKVNAKVSPKDILFRFSEEFEKNLMEKKDFIGYIGIILKELDAGEIRIASRDDTIQKFIDANSPQETWKTNNGNWFYPIFTSIAGSKSDRYMHRAFNVETTSLSGCLAQNTVHLENTHTFGAADEAKINTLFLDLQISDTKERNILMGIEGKAKNAQYIRFIVPPKASLNSSDPDRKLMIDTSNPLYSVISFYQDTDVGQKTESTVSYTIPVADCTTNMQFFKQPGLMNYEFRQR